VEASGLLRGAGSIDARAFDGPLADAGAADAPAPDTALADAPLPDAARADARAPDGAAPDAPAPDADSPDAPPPDARPPLPADLPIGVNIPDLLWAYLGTTHSSTASDAAGERAIMDHARSFGFTHARFAATPYWPIDMTSGNGWVADPGAYWAAFDALVADARTRGLRLIPDILWSTNLFPDIAGEAVGELFTPGSKSRLLAEKYITELVTRYRDDDTILLWEIGNEMNLLADIDYSMCDACNGKTADCGNLAPVLGTPCRRTAADDFYSCDACRGVSSMQQDLGAFAASMAALIHGLDPSRKISSGDATPRPAAYHLSVSPCPSCDFTLDTEAQFRMALAQTHPAGVDVVSIHIGPSAEDARFGSTDQTGSFLVGRTKIAADLLGKTFMAGEFGEPGGATTMCGPPMSCGGDATRAATGALLDAFVVDHIGYANVWVWEFYQFCVGVPACFSIGPSDPIAASMTTHNEAFGACTTKANGTPCPIGSCQHGTCTP
jgi:hypothetical protein